MAKVVTDNQHYIDIASAIRTKIGDETTYKPNEMAEAVVAVYNKGYEQGQAEGGGVSGSNKLPAYVDGSLMEITKDDLRGATLIKNYAFYHSECTSIKIPDSITSIGVSAFAYSSNLETVELPSGISSLSTALFSNCSKLANITIPDSVTDIGNTVFTNCSNLTNLTIPASVTNIGTTALRIGDATNKATFIFLATNPPTIIGTTFNKTSLNKIIVPLGCGDVYKAATNWANFADYIEEATE